MRLQYWLVLICVMAGSVAYAQLPDSLWSRVYGGTGDERCFCFCQAANGGMLLAGDTDSYGHGGRDFWAVRTNNDGDTLWTKAIGGGTDDICLSAQQTTDGGFILAGFTSSFGAGNEDFYLVKVDASGDTLWTRTYGGSGGDWCTGVQQSQDGNYICIGYTQSYGAGSDDLWLIRTDANGDTLWTKTFGGTASDRGRSVLELPSAEGFILAGYTASHGSGDYDYWLIETDEDGNESWSHTYGGAERDRFYSICTAVDGGYVLTGFTLSWGAGAEDYWMVKTNAIGDSLWSKTFGGINTEYCHTVDQTEDGGYLLSGYTDSFGSGATDVYIVRTDSIGDSLWTQSLGGSNWEQCWGAFQTSDGEFYLAGRTNSLSVGSDVDFWLIKLSSEAAMEVTPSTLEFGRVLIDSSDTITSTIRNTGYFPLQIDSLIIPEDFSVQIIGPNPVPEGDSTELQVTFTPTRVRDYNEILLIESNANKGIDTLELVGNGGFIYSDVEFSRTFGGSGDEKCYSMENTSDGGFILAGYTESYGVGGKDFWLLKTDSNGDSVWSRTYGGIGDEICNSVQQLPDNGFILAGYTNSYGAGEEDWWYIRTDASGDTLWTRTFGSAMQDKANAVSRTSEGGFVIAGRNGDFNTGYYILTDQNGGIINQGEIESHMSECRSVYLASDGDYIFAGSDGYQEGVVVKHTGTEIRWLFLNQNLPRYGPVNAVIQTSNGNIVSSGVTENWGSNGRDFFVERLHGVWGEFLWSQYYGGPEFGEQGCQSIQSTSDGGFILAGYTNVEFGFEKDFWLVKADGNGNYQWSKTLGGENHDICYAVVQTSDGDYVMAGYTESYGAGQADFWLVKTSGCRYAVLPSVSDMVISIENDYDAHLAWSPVRDAYADCEFEWNSYLVYFAENSDGPFWFHGFTPDTTYTHAWVVPNADHMYYMLDFWGGPTALLDQMPRPVDGHGKITREEVHRTLYSLLHRY